MLSDDELARVTPGMAMDAMADSFAGHRMPWDMTLRLLFPLHEAGAVADRIEADWDDSDLVGAGYRADLMPMCEVEVALTRMALALDRAARRESLPPNAGSCPAPWEVTR